VDHKRAVEVLGDIERLAEVNDLRAGDLRIWPLIRLEFWHQLLKPANQRQATAASSGLQLRSMPVVHSMFRWQEMGKLRRLPQAEALFLSRHEDHNDRLPDGFYNRHTDPMLAFCRERMSSLKIEPLEPATERTLPRSVETEFLRIERLAPLGPVPRIEGIERLRATLDRVGETLILDEESLQAQARVLLQWRDAFLAVLDHVQPRVVFVVCYYDRRVLAMVAACRARGIPVVDIQHGKQGIYHGAYTHWTRWPEGGYELLPDFFWLWGEASRRNIACSQPPDLKRHRPVVGGSRWLALWRGGDAFPPEPAPAAWLSEVGKAARVILVTLQPIDPPIPPCVREAVQRSPADWLWLFRVHPQRRADIPKLSASLAAAGGGRFEFEHASTVPLYALLRITHRHVTCWSSVAFEAPAFDVPTMIVHPSGQSLYAEDIAAGRFTFTQSAEDLLAWVESAPKVNEAEPYIETSAGRAESALAEILAKE